MAWVNRKSMLSWQSALIFSLFFLWGVAGNLNDILIKQFKKAFTLNDMKASLVQSAFYFGYFFGALPAAKVACSCGYKISITVGLCLFSLGSVAFLPASHNGGSLTEFLLCLYVLAFGCAFLESSANPWIVLLAEAQKPGTGTKAINVAQSFNALGSIVGVLVGRFAILDGFEYEEEAQAKLSHDQLWEYRAREAALVGPPYLLIGLCAAGVAAAFSCTPFPSIQSEEEEENKNNAVGEDECAGKQDGTKGCDKANNGKRDGEEGCEVEEEAVSLRSLRVGTVGRLSRNGAYVQGAVAIFLSVGAQISMWSFIIRYVQANIEGVSELRAADCVMLSLVLYVVGRFAAFGLMVFLGSGKEPHLLLVFNVMGALCCATAPIASGGVGVAAVCGSSFFTGTSFPTIFGLSLSSVPRGDTAVAGAILVMCTVGGAVITPIMGLVSDSLSISVSYLVPATCLVLVARFALQHVLGRAGERGQDNFSKARELNDPTVDA